MLASFHGLFADQIDIPLKHLKIIVFEELMVDYVSENHGLDQRELNRWSQFSEQKVNFFFKSENLKKMLLIKMMGR